MSFQVLSSPSHTVPLGWVDLPDRRLRDDEVRVAVRAASVNPVDWKMREGDFQLKYRLWELESGGHAVEADRERLAQVKVELDRYWDLLRRRRSSERAGGDPEQVGLRDEGTVENYLQ